MDEESWLGDCERCMTCNECIHKEECWFAQENMHTEVEGDDEE